MNVGERIKNIRTSKKLSARQLALKCNVSPAQISMIENSSANPSLDLLERICHILEIPLAEFFSDKLSTQSPEVIQLMKSVENLTPEQIKQLTNFINSMTENNSNQSIR